MDPSDRLEEDFKFYLYFFENNLKELQNEKDKALCQEWLQRLEGMRKTRKQRRDRNVYLSQLALAMAEGQLCPPFNAPPPRELPPLCASLFGLFPSGVEVSENPQIHESGASSFPTKADTSGKYWSNAAFAKEKSQCNIHTPQAHDENASEKPEKNPPEMYSFSTRAGTSGKHRPNFSFENEENEWNINGETASEKPEKNPPGLYSFFTRPGTSGKHRPNFAFENEKNEWNINGETVPQNQPSLHIEIPLYYARCDTNKGQSSETNNKEQKNKWSNDERLAADEFDLRKPETLQSGAPPFISSSDISDEQLPETNNRAEESKPSKEALLTAGEMELHATKLSESHPDMLRNVRTNPVKNLDDHRPEQHSNNHPDSWTKLLSKVKIHSRKRLNFKRPELHSTDLSERRTNVLSKAKFSPEMDLNLHRPVFSRTCPRPSQMPIAGEVLGSQSTDDELVTSQWADIVKQDKDGNHGSSFESLLSYSKGQWVDSSCDSESFKSALSVKSATSTNESEINRQSDLPSVLSEPFQQIRHSEVVIQSVSLQSVQSQSRQSTPGLSVTSLVSTGEQEHHPTPEVQNKQDRFTQTQPENYLPHEPNFHMKHMFLPVYIASSNQQPYFVYTPVLTSQTEGHQMIIPTVTQLPSTSEQSQQ